MHVESSDVQILGWVYDLSDVWIIIIHSFLTEIYLGAGVIFTMRGLALMEMWSYFGSV